MKLAWFLAVRLLRKKGTVLLRTSGVAALLAVGLGAASLVVVLAIMSGYTRALRDGILSAVGHLTVMLPAENTPAARTELHAALARCEEVTASGEVALLPGLLFAEGGEGGELMTVRGATAMPPFATVPEADVTGPLPIALGAGSARRLGAPVGTVLALQVFSGGMPRLLSVRVASVFRTGFVELDEHWAVARLAHLQRRLPEVVVTTFEVWLRDPERAVEVAARLDSELGQGALVTTWEDMPSNRDVFAALRWQKISLALVLSLVLGVGAFEVASAIVVLLTEKRRTVALLMAIGGEGRLVAVTLLLAGGTLGCLGVLGGTAVGAAIVGTLRALGVPSFPPDIASIYMVDHIPLQLQLGDLLLVLGLGGLEVVLASLMPMRRVLRLRPVEMLRWV